MKKLSKILVAVMVLSMLDPVKTITYVWDFQVYKYTNADGSKKPLADAQFSVYEVNPEVDPSASAMWVKFIETDADGIDIYEHIHNPADTIDGYIEVLNSTGVVLPETGGIGTILFISIGSFLVLSMGVLLVVKKRMSQVIFTK